MKFKAMITHTDRLENGLIQSQTKHITGSRTAIFNAISDIMIDGEYNLEKELIDITVVIKKEEK